MIQNVVGSQHGLAHCNRVGPPVEAQRYHPGMSSVQDESGTPAAMRAPHQRETSAMLLTVPAQPHGILVG